MFPEIFRRFASALRFVAGRDSASLSSVGRVELSVSVFPMLGNLTSDLCPLTSAPAINPVLQHSNIPVFHSPYLLDIAVYKGRGRLYIAALK